MNEDDFLRAIRTNPADESTWLVYADWLDEHGDPRGEYLRLRCEQKRIEARLTELIPRLNSTWLALFHGPWRAVLTSYPFDKKIHAIKLVRELTHLGLKEAKDLVESESRVIKDALSRAEAVQLQRRFEAEGMTVTVEPSVALSQRQAPPEGRLYRALLFPCPMELRIQAVKLIREVTGLGLTQSLDLVNAAPSVIREGLTPPEAERIRDRLQQAGLTVTLEPAREVAPVPAADTGERYRLTLTDCPPRRKSALTRLVRQLAGVGPSEARAMIEELPNTIRRGLTRAEADHARGLFDAEGIPVLIESEDEGG